MQDERLSQSLCFALVCLFRQVNRTHNRALARYELSAEQAHVMVILWLDGAQKIGELQRQLMVSSGTLTGTLDRMERIGLLHRKPDPDDKRAFWVAPGPMKEAKRSAIIDTVEEADGACFAALTAAERREMLRLLHKASQGLVDSEGEGSPRGPASSRNKLTAGSPTRAARGKGSVAS